MFNSNGAVFITAVGTPVDNEGKLIEKSFRKHLRDQIKNGVDGFLVMGTMGMMPCLSSGTYLKCAEASQEEIGKKAKVMVGVGDNSIERTLEKVRSIKRLKIDAVVATTPFYFFSSQNDLIYYFTKVADNSAVPLYLYDLPQRTNVKIEFDTVLKLSRHKNIKGIKCSHDAAWTRKLSDELSGRGFEVISAHYDLIDVFLKYGMRMQLDGFFAIMPSWLKEIKDAYSINDFEEITRIQKKMTWLRDEFAKLGVFPAFTVAMNMLGFEGRFHPSHMCDLNTSFRSNVKDLLKKSGLL